MRITFRQLQIFTTIAKTGSTVAAAQSLPLSQSAASTALHELEADLGVDLFDRVGKRLSLNDNGRAMLPLAVQALDATREIEAAFADNSRGVTVELNIFASTTIGNYVLPKLFPNILALLPSVRFSVTIGNTGEVLAAIKEFSIDVGLIEGPCHDQAVNVDPWFEEDLIIVASPAHPLAQASKRRRLSAAVLQEAPWLLREPGSGTREAVELALAPHLHNMRSIMTLGSSEAIKHSIAEGIGIGCLPAAVVRDLLEEGKLTALKTSLPRLVRNMSIVHHRKKRLSSVVMAFIDCCKSNQPALRSGTA